MDALDLGVTLQGPADSLATTARRFEGLGVQSLWSGDYFQSALVRAAIIGAATARVPVGTHVLQAFARSPLATALAAEELQVLTRGRFVLGLGSQLPAANRRWHGLAVDRPIAALREYVAAVRLLLDTPGDQTVRFEGQRLSYDIGPYRTAARPERVPVWIGAAGPATVRLSADIADGLAGHLLWGYAHVRDVVRPVVGSRLPITVPRLVGAATVPGARADLSRRLAHYLTTPAYQAVLTAQGFALDRDALLAAVRCGDDPAISRIVEPHVDTWCISTADDLRRHRIDARSAGADTLMLLVPASPDGRRTSAYERELAELIAS